MFKFLEKKIVKILSIKKVTFISDIFLHIILKIRGYKNFGNYDDTGEKYFLNFLKKNKIKNCIDIGAHQGSYSKELLNFNNSKVLAFEPMDGSFNQLKNIKKEYKNRFNFFKIALSNKPGNNYIFFTNKYSQLSTLNTNTKRINFLKSKQFKRKKIKVDTLDRFFFKNKKYFPKKIDFIKIDTEGNDYKVLLGAKKFLQIKKPKYIQIEMNYHYLFEGENIYMMHKLLKNYDVYKILPYNNGLLKIDTTRPENNIYHLSNFVFIKR